MNMTETTKGPIHMTMQSLHRLSFLFALALILAANSALAQSKIGVADIDKIIERSQTVSQAVKKAEATLKTRQNEIESKMNELQQSRQELERKRSVMSEDQVKSEQEKISRQTEQIKDLQYQTNKELSRIRQEVMPPEVDRIMEAVRQVARTDGYDVILPAETVLFHADKTDITSLVIQLLDKNNPGSFDKSDSDSTEKKSSASSDSDEDKPAKSTSTRRARPRLPRDEN